MNIISPARPDLHHDLRTGDAGIPSILTRETRSAGELVDAYTRAAEVVDTPAPAPDAPDHVKAAHNPASVSATRERLYHGRPVSGDLIAILRAFGGNLVIARTVSQVEEDLRDSVPDLIQEGDFDVEALLMVGAAWLTGGQVPFRYAIRADSTLARHIFENREEASLILKASWGTDAKALDE